MELAATLPPGFKFVDANNSGRYDPATRKVQWLLEELPPNQKGSVTLTALPIEAGPQMITIGSTAQRGLNVEKQEQVVVEGVAAIMFEVADLADPVELGGETTFEVKVVNQGSKAASNVRLTALMPPEMKALSAEGPTRFLVDGQQVRFEELPRLAPKASTVYRIRCNARPPATCASACSSRPTTSARPSPKKKAPGSTLTSSGGGGATLPGERQAPACRYFAGRLR